VTRRRGRRREQRVDDLKETRGYWKLKRGSTTIARYRQLFLVEAMDLSYGRLPNKCQFREQENIM
jgi:hypothetical protein